MAAVNIRDHSDYGLSKSVEALAGPIPSMIPEYLLCLLFELTRFDCTLRLYLYLHMCLVLHVYLHLNTHTYISIHIRYSYKILKSASRYSYLYQYPYTLQNT